VPRRAKIRPDEPGRDKVLAAALELFGERGYHATGVAEIGLRAGIAKSVLYHYFESKAGLYEEIAAQQARDLMATVAAAVPEDPDAPRLRAGVDAFLAFLAERPTAWRLLLRDPPADPELAAVNERHRRELEEALGVLLTQRKKRGREQPQAGIVATAIRAFATWWYEHQDVPRELVVDAIMDVAAAAANHIPPARGHGPLQAH
jgi:AcrR family transcriptional regulator